VEARLPGGNPVRKVPKVSKPNNVEGLVRKFCFGINPGMDAPSG
jgi:hypothetical protein